MMLQAERTLGAVIENARAKFAQLVTHYGSADAAISAVADAVVRHPPPGEVPGQLLVRQLCGVSPLAQRLDKIGAAAMYLNFAAQAWSKSSDMLVKKYPNEGMLIVDPLAVLAANAETAHEKVAANVLATYNPVGTTIELNCYESNLILAFSPLIPELGRSTVAVEPHSQVVAVLRDHFPRLLADYNPEAESTLSFEVLASAYTDLRIQLAQVADRLFGKSLPLKLY